MSQRPYCMVPPLPARSRLRCDHLRKPHNFGMLFQIMEDLFAIGVDDLGGDLCSNVAVARWSATYSMPRPASKR